jgi:hypothetical protein
MSEPNAPTPQGADDSPFDAKEDLQFDQAEYTTPLPAGPTCGLCNQPIADVYFEVGGKVFCGTCRGRIEQSLRGGSRMGRVFKAFAFGAAAAAAGGALYYAIIKATNINFGLISVLVGFMVGRAVRAGTGNRGGRFYQFLAVFLTYSMIVGMYVPVLLEVFNQDAQKAEQAGAVPAKNDVDRPKANAPAAGVKPVEAPEANAPPTAPPAQDPKPKIAPHNDKNGRNNDAPPQAVPPPSLSRILMSLLIFITFMIGFIYSLPVQAAIHDPISGLIFSFALWEAWKITKRVQVSINGPFRVSTPAPEAYDHGG